MDTIQELFDLLQKIQNDPTKDGVELDFNLQYLLDLGFISYNKLYNTVGISSLGSIVLLGTKENFISVLQQALLQKDMLEKFSNIISRLEQKLAKIN